jgi:hypothetical protein
LNSGGDLSTTGGVHNNATAAAGGAANTPVERVLVQIPKDKLLRARIDRLAKLVQAEGHQGEQLVMQGVMDQRSTMKMQAAQRNEPPPRHGFDFLFDHNTEENLYFAMPVMLITLVSLLCVIGGTGMVSL